MYSVISDVPAARTAKTGRCFVTSQRSTANEGLDRHPTATEAKAIKPTMALTRSPRHQLTPPRTKPISMAHRTRSRYLPHLRMVAMSRNIKALPVMLISPLHPGRGKAPRCPRILPGPKTRMPRPPRYLLPSTMSWRQQWEALGWTCQCHRLQEDV